MINASTLVVLITIVINMTGVGLFWPILPSLVKELGGGDISHAIWTYGAITTVFALMQFLFAPVMGVLSDRFGRRPVLLVALTGMGIDSLLIAFAPNLFWIFLGRALGGILGATYSVSNAYMADISKKEDRAAAFGLVGAAFGIGFILGPLMGGVLGKIDIRLPIYVAAGLSFTNVIFGYFFLKESLAPDKRVIKPLLQSNILSTFAWLKKQPVILFLAISLFVANTIQRGLESIWVLFTGVQFGWDSQQAGLSLAIVGICFFIVQGFLVRRVVAYFGETKTVAIGFSLSALVYVLLSVNEISLIGYLGIIPHVLGWGVAGPALQAMASKQVDETQQGFLQGALTSISGMSAIIGPIVAAAIFGYFTSSNTIFYFPGAYFLFGSVLMLFAAWIGSRHKAA